MDVSLSNNDKSAVDAAIVALKAQSIWTELDWFNFALATEQQTLLNWKNPGTGTGQRATKTGTVNFVAYQGMTGNGTDGIMDTGLTDTTATAFSQDDCSMGIRLHALGASSTAICGNTKARFLINTGGTFTYRANTTGDMTGVATGSNTSPFDYAWSRDGASSARSYFNGAGETASTTASSAPNAGTFQFCGVGTAFSNHTIKSYWYGGQLSGAQHASMKSILDTLAAALNL